MSENDSKPVLSGRGRTAAEARQKRQAEALRANLARRKTQVRGRQDETAPPEPDATPPVPDKTSADQD